MRGCQTEVFALNTGRNAVLHIERPGLFYVRSTPTIEPFEANLGEFSVNIALTWSEFLPYEYEWHRRHLL